MAKAITRIQPTQNGRFLIHSSGLRIIAVMHCEPPPSVRSPLSHDLGVPIQLIAKPAAGSRRLLTAHPTTLLITVLAAVALSGCAGANTSAAVEVTDDETDLRRLSRSVQSSEMAHVERAPVIDTPQSAPYVLPHSPSEVLSDYWDCRGSRQHRGLDFVGLSENFGLGRSVVSIGRARVLEIGTPEIDSDQFGRRLTNRRETFRGGQTVPTSAEIDGYGQVFFFTRSYGSGHTGVVVVTELLDGPLAGHVVRYLHLAAVHPGLTVGAEIAAGQELGLMGGTAVMHSAPHVHVDIETSNGRRVDFTELLGLEPATERPDCG